MSFAVVPVKTIDAIYGYLIQRPMVEVEGLVKSLRDETKELEVFNKKLEQERLAEKAGKRPAAKVPTTEEGKA